MLVMDSRIQQQSNPIGILNLLVDYLEEQHYDAQKIFDRFAIQLNDLNNNLFPISLQIQGQIFDVVQQLTGCDHLGLMIGQKAQLANIGPLRFLVLNAATIRDALESLFQYGTMWYRGQKLDLKEEQGYARICMQIDEDIPAKDQYQTAYLAAMASIMSLLMGTTWRPSLVRIAYTKPKNALIYEKFFGCPVWFGQAQHEILFPKIQLDQKRIGHDQPLDQFLRQHLSSLQENDQIDLMGQICKIIEALLPQGQCSMERVAEYFSMHRFTLYRYLNQYQTTFENLLEYTRKNLAVKLLKKKEFMIIDIASQVGYENQANFTRAFKRWFGVTPGRWRKINLIY
ncbi:MULTISPECIES: AraC family transcriptional regulator [unclassified Acinetobacter]|uniref:AraC family transcriptional regulator n=1 Tax=unclassified Acinetobacter TaxID=196816 RepID=UPI002934A25F|nr:MULTISPECIES: AraC family transcriptional regulator ligand-binding domain-containing protein [unclassified Acinetobacter]WOE33135.1 AraC family transcriptional regulator ligand-binding domain-containing protein [Acinetobacter sp. SAAs470]WOE39801.1 AraC family transcriptional regulator ligand-binding domain-containing protein [Acinetobacter sp. SAAs474]